MFVQVPGAHISDSAYHIHHIEVSGTSRDSWVVTKCIGIIHTAVKISSRLYVVSNFPPTALSNLKGQVPSFYT